MALGWVCTPEYMAFRWLWGGLSSRTNATSFYRARSRPVPSALNVGRWLFPRIQSQEPAQPQAQCHRRHADVESVCRRGESKLYDVLAGRHLHAAHQVVAAQ